jgi:hypothetical protein
MPVPLLSLGSSRCHLRRPHVSLLFGLLLLPVTLLAGGPKPATRINLEDVGFQPLSSRYLLDGSSMLSLHYVDDTHVLLTYGAKRLIPRIPNDPPTDQDRNVDVLLLELPSGKVVARAEWLFHDHGQYLWSLGHGEFLLRTRDTFTTFAPLRNLASGKPFQQFPFLHTDRRVIAVILSPDNTFLTVESTDPIPLVDPDPPSAFASVFGPEPNKPTRVQLNFYRLGLPDESGQVLPRVAGIALARHAIELPLTSEGLLNVLDQGHQSWAFDFKAYHGKRSELALFDSTCRPSPRFISPSEFLVFGCHGGTTRQLLAAFNLRGDATWQMALTGTYVAPTFVFAPAAGRFALGRLIINSAAVGIDSIDPSMVQAEAVDVIQNDSGRTLFHIECTPAARAGQNFALSPDGMNLAVIHEGALEIYALPQLAPQDKNAIQLAQKSAPPATEVEVDLSEISTRASDASGHQYTQQDTLGANDPLQTGPQAAPATSPANPQSAATQPASSATPASSPASTPEETSDDPPVHRKPPTLYNPPAPDPAQPPQ